MRKRGVRFAHFQLVNCGANIPVVPNSTAIVQHTFDLRLNKATNAPKRIQTLISRNIFQRFTAPV
jgi:hypothetical protein